MIGSGIGGLSTAALLAKAGKKVLVLEQHDQVRFFFSDELCLHTLRNINDWSHPELTKAYHLKDY